MFLLNDNTFVEGDRDNPVTTPSNVRRIGIAFLNDIAHAAVPNTTVGPDGTPPGPGPDGIMLDNPVTTVGGNEAADNTPAIPADPGPDGVFGTACGTPTASIECVDDVAAIPEGPGPDGILLDDPNTFPGGNEAADNTPFIQDGVAGGSLDVPSPAGSYDDELLDLHFIAGDGRVNENIGLTTIHQLFHSEHDRLIDDMQATLNANPALLAQFQATSSTTFTYGERMFQAARFVTEMEYQHLVFEEFARKVQPAIDPFQPFAFNQTDVNPAITAEFAHAVYRFGHSMLTEDIDRFIPTPSTTDAPNKGQHFSIPLLDGFLNPASYTDGPGSQVLTSQQAAGAVIMGLSDQVGNEIDEFVTDTLRNNLLGLPLDLPSINMARARSEGIPPLNSVRRQIFAKTNSPELAPYVNWIDFGLALKHPESLVNFVAAYGRHPSITVENTIERKREAARILVSPVLGDTPPADALAFISSGIYVDTDLSDGDQSRDWSNAANGVTQTGVDDIDLWVGGLAEVTNPFGGLLGSTFNYVFEAQLTNLQNGDRLYYLARTPGMNLRAQLEGNSFAELMMRNTTATTLKADPFATADCKFEFASNPGIANNTGLVVEDDPASECDETALLIRQPATTAIPIPRIQYRSRNSVDPSGINGQSVYNGTAADDYMWGGNDNDTFLGNEGNDVIEGAAGDDRPLGGDGNDVITDLAGDDILKGGPGHDALDGGIGLDILMGGDGDDLTSGGGNSNTAFLGAGDDYAIGGSGVDAVFGDSGDDWEEGGDFPDLLIGDSSTLFFDDHNLPGNDVLIGQGGDDDGDSEGGDDVIVGGPGIEKNAGAAGFDWVIGLNDPQPQDADLNRIFFEAGVPVITVRDRYNEVEALSGWNLNDVLRGDDFVPTAQGGGGFIGCDALDQDGLDRISGLDPLVPPLTVDSTPITAAASTSYCLLIGNVWGAGNILLGGAGSDIMEGRGADDILDGDRYMNVRISVRSTADHAVEIGSTDLLEHQALSGDFGPGTAGMTLQQAIFARKLTANDLEITREIITPVVPAADCAAAAPVNCDTAVFSGASTEYTITLGADGITVNHTGGLATDGIDTVRNVERLQFTNETVSLTAPAAPAAPTATAGLLRATVNWVAVPGSTLFPITGYTITVQSATPGAVIPAPISVGNVTTFTVLGLTADALYTFTVTATNAFGTSAPSAQSNAVVPFATAPLTVAPSTLVVLGADLTGPAAGSVGHPLARNIYAQFSENVLGASVNLTTVTLRVTATNALVPRTVTYQQNVAVIFPARLVTINPTDPLLANTQYTVTFNPTGGSCPSTGIRTSNLVATCKSLATTSWTFTTGGGPVANVAPTVTATVPVANATNVARGANITATFSEPVTGVSAATATLTRSNGDVIVVAVTLNAAGTIATINPAVNLRRNTTFTVRLIGGPTAIREAAATSLPLVTTSWSFTTAP